MKEENKYGKHKQPIEWYQSKLVEYIKKNNPEKLKFNPTVIKIQNDQLTFGMEKHSGRLVMSLKTLDDFHTDQMKKIYARLWGDSQLMEQLILDDEQ
ncbi:hypothetical protein FORMA_13130 [Formosa sp. Hel3_A1_48]|uniref:hypothetical protein n=1 Tax=Formosa sp. Hel3_A1_48 TaxID=1336795 RepID=UPI00084E1113|nr:hypothetical protein [Formosa sp. Hel3_A1_48]AOR26473.1 hypothetical protein FORMA_13130 [Formosa sp. Hel3_A1_48]